EHLSRAPAILAGRRRNAVALDDRLASGFLPGILDHRVEPVGFEADAQPRRRPDDFGLRRGLDALAHFLEAQALAGERPDLGADVADRRDQPVEIGRVGPGVALARG